MPVSPLEQMVRDVQAQGYSRQEAERIVQEYFARLNAEGAATSPLDRMVREIQAQGYSRGDAERLVQEFFARLRGDLPVQPGLDALVAELEQATRLRIAEIDAAARMWLQEREAELQRELQQGRLSAERYRLEMELAQREAEFARDLAQRQAEFEKEYQLRSLGAERSFALEAARLAANPTDWLAYQHLLARVQIPDVGLPLPPAASPAALRQTAAALVGGQNPAYNPYLGGTGQFGIPVPAPNQIPRSVAASWTPVQTQMLAGLLRGGVRTPQGQVALSPEDWFGQLERSFVPEAPREAFAPMEYRF